MKRTVLFVILLPFLLLVLLSCKPSPGVFTIGIIAPLSGQYAGLGEDIVRSAQLAAEKNGIALNVEDDQCDGKIGLTAATKLIEAQGIDAIITVCTSTAQTIYSLTKEKGLIHIALTETYLYEDDQLFQMMPPSSKLFFDLGTFAGKTFGNIAIIYTDESVNEGPFGNPTQLSLGITSSGGKVILNEKIPQKTTDFRPILLKIKHAVPSRLAVIMFKEDHALFLKQYKELGLDTRIPLLGNLYYEIDFDSIYSVLGAQGLMDTYSVGFNQTRQQWFIDSFNQKYGKDPGLFSDYGYDAVTVLSKAQSAAPTSSLNSIKQSLFTSTFHGAAGDFTFNSQGNTQVGTLLKRFNSTGYSPVTQI